MPDANFNGAASFTYKVKDALGAVSANSATVTVNVLGVNDAPTAVADTVSPSVGKSYTFTAAQLLGNDTDPDTAYGDSVSIRSVGGATGGSVYDIVLASGLMTRAQLDDVLAPENLTRPRPLPR